MTRKLIRYTFYSYIDNNRFHGQTELANGRPGCQGYPHANSATTYSVHMQGFAYAVHRVHLIHDIAKHLYFVGPIFRPRALNCRTCTIRVHSAVQWTQPVSARLVTDLILKHQRLVGWTLLLKCFMTSNQLLISNLILFQELPTSPKKQSKLLEGKIPRKKFLPKVSPGENSPKEKCLLSKSQQNRPESFQKT